MKKSSKEFIHHPVLVNIFDGLTYLMCMYGITKHSLNLGLTTKESVFVLCLSMIASFMLGYDEYKSNQNEEGKKEDKHHDCSKDKKVF